MTGYKRIFIDTSPFIYYLENSSLYFGKMLKFFTKCYMDKIEIVTSTITVEEYLVYPYSGQKTELIENFDRFLKYMKIKVVPIDEEIARQAAKVRAKYKDFKAMDALQIATACISKCDLIFTNDKQLRQFEEIKCITIDEW